MIWWFMAAIALALCAGIGIKWMVDRIWPPEVERLAAYDRGFTDGRDAAQLQPRPPKMTMLDDTMEVLGAGYEAGIRTGRHARPEFTSPHLATGMAAEAVTGPALEQVDPAPFTLPRSLVYRDDDVVPADVLTADYADKAALYLEANGQQPAGGGL